MVSEELRMDSSFTRKEISHKFVLYQRGST